MEPILREDWEGPPRASIIASRRFTDLGDICVVGRKCNINKPIERRSSNTELGVPSEEVLEAVLRARQRVLDWAQNEGLRRNRSMGSRYQGGSNILGCGLTEDELLDLLYRDIDPEDYETLLKLDETIAKKTCEKGVVEGLESRRAAEFANIQVGEDLCQICLVPFEDDDLATSLPCKHTFHKECVSKWLSDCKNACPVCKTELS